MAEQAQTSDTGYGSGLTEVEVQRLQDILRRDCGVDLTVEDAWARAVELLAFGELLLKSLSPHASTGM